MRLTSLTGFDIVIHGWSGDAPGVMLGSKKIAARVVDGNLRFTLPDLPSGATVTLAR